MNGSYKGRSTAVSIAGGVMFCLLLVFFAVNRGEYSVLMPACFVPLLFSLWLSDNLPCRFSADSEGFEINEMFFTARYNYDDIWNVKYEQVFLRPNDYIKLTLTGSFGERVYYERCGKESSKLTELCKYINGSRGARA